MLDIANEAFNQMSLTIPPGVVFVRFLGILVGGDDRFRASGDDFIPKIRCTITPARKHKVKHQVNNQGMSLEDVMTLSGTQAQPQRIAQTIDGDVDFGAEPTATTAQRLFSLTTVFFVAPAAHAWARTIVLSIIPFSISGSAAK